MMEYKILTDNTGGGRLEDAVTEHISDGWEPLGGISIAQTYSATTNHTSTTYTQAVIRKYET